MNISQLEQILHIRPFSPLFARLAHEYISVNRTTDAIKLLQNGIQSHPDYSTAYFALAECYLQDQKPQDAFEAIERAVHLNPGIETIQQVRNEIKIITEKFSDAVSPPSAAGETDVVGSPVLSEQEAHPAEKSPEITEAEASDESLVAEELNALLQAAELDNIEPPFEESGSAFTESTGEDENIAASEIVPDTTETDQDAEHTQELSEAAPSGDSINQEKELTEMGASVVHEAEAERTQAPEEASSDHADIIRENVHGTETSAASSQTLDDKVESPTAAESEPELPEDDYRIVSKTLAEIYVSQGEYGEALLTYRLLKHQKPELGEQIDRRIEELEKMLHNAPPLPPQT